MENHDVFIVAARMAEFSIIVGIIVGISRYKNLDSSQKYLLLLLVLSLLTELISAWFIEIDRPTFPILHVYAVFEFAVFVMIFSDVFRGGNIGRALKISIPFITLFGILNACFLQPLSAPNTNVVVVSGLIIISTSVLFLFRTLSKMVYRHIERSALFWISVGALIYFSSTILMFVFLTKLAPVNMNIKGDILILNAIFNIIHYICFTIALWMKPE